MTKSIHIDNQLLSIKELINQNEAIQSHISNMSNFDNFNYWKWKEYQTPLQEVNS